jgi:hypothetical protein
MTHASPRALVTLKNSTSLRGENSTGTAIVVIEARQFRRRNLSNV